MFEFLMRYKAKAAVLLYHRIADTAIDPAQLSVSPQMFEQQLTVLSRHYNVVSCEQLIYQIQKKKLTENCVCITFDDGYTDNVSIAIPLLDKFKMPATFFIATDFIDTNRSFWWDEVADILLGTIELPKVIELEANEVRFSFRLSNPRLDANEAKLLREWNWDQPVVSERCNLYFEILNLLKSLKLEQIEQLMSSIRNWKDVPDVVTVLDKPMQSRHLEILNENSFSSVGVHTCTHPLLPKHESSFQDKEISNCKLALKKKWNIEAPLVAYPYGQYNQATLNSVKRAGIVGGFTTEPVATTSSTKILEIGRFHVGNWNEVMFKSELEKILS